MSAPILRLYGDIWTLIARKLSTEDCLKLTSTGCPALAHAIQARCEVLELEPNRFVEVDLSLQRASKFAQLNDLSIMAPTDSLHCTWPVTLQYFPAGLTSLSLRFKYSTDVFLTHLDLATVAPSLLHLKLAGKTTIPKPLSTARLPSTLLSLFISTPVSIDAEIIGLLPRSLTSLYIRPCSAVETSMAFLGECDWMPGLTSLTIAPLPVILTTLPWYLRELSFGRIAITSPGALPQNEELAFPWRVFFPRLESLSTPCLLPQKALLHLVDPNQLDAMPHLRPFAPQLTDEERSTPLPPWKLINATFAGRIDTVFSPIPHELKHQLSRLESFSCFYWRPEWFHLFPSLTNLDACFTQYPSNTVLALPRLTKLDIAGLRSDQIPPSTTWLRARIQACETPFPAQSLTYLETNMSIDEALISILPPSLETLVGIFRSTPTNNFNELLSDLSPKEAQGGDFEREDWDLFMNPCDRAWCAMATRLTNLKHLVIEDSSGFPSQALTPINSPQFESISLHGTAPAAGRAWMATLFDGMNTAGRPAVLPPSTKSVKITLSRGSVPLSILPMLPRSLTDFTVSSMNDHKNRLPNFPLDPTSTPTDFLALLPPGLKTLAWDAHPVSSISTMLEPSAVLSLPRTLTSLSLPPQFTIELTHNKIAATLAPLWPPNLTELSYNIWGLKRKTLASYTAYHGKTLVSSKLVDSWTSPTLTD